MGTVKGRDSHSEQQHNSTKMKTFFAAVLVASLLAIALSAPNPEAAPEGDSNSEFGENDNVQVQQLQLGGAGADAEINQAMLEGAAAAIHAPAPNSIVVLLSPRITATSRFSAQTTIEKTPTNIRLRLSLIYKQCITNWKLSDIFRVTLADVNTNIFY